MRDLRRLRAFHAVVELGSFSLAALELGYAQSAVSHHVAVLERELGLTLIDRGTRPVGVTDAGARLARHAEAILGHVAAAEDELRAVAGLQGGRLRVGAFLSACSSFLPAALARFEHAHPDIEVTFDQLEAPDALRRVRSGDLDLAVVWRIPGHGGAVPDESFAELKLADDPYRVVLAARHRLARHKTVRMADLGAERFIAPPLTSHTTPYQALLEYLWSAAAVKPPIQPVEDVTVARAMIAAGLSVGLLSELTMPEPRPDIALRPLRDGDPMREIHATWLEGRRVPAASRMVRYLAEAAAATLGPPADGDLPAAACRSARALPP